MTAHNSETTAKKRKARNRTPAAVTPALPDKNGTLRVTRVPDKTEARMLTDLAAHGVATNAATAMRFIRHGLGDLSLTDMVSSLRELGEAVHRGDLSAAEQMLNSQAVALNAIFAEMARRAALNMGEHLSATEAYMRLALKAQSQCRTTIETLHEMKNPRPVAFVKQANIANGPQQVNNGAAPTNTRTGAHAGETQSAPHEQSGTDHELLSNTGASQATSGTHSHLEAVGAVNRAAKP